MLTRKTAIARLRATGSLATGPRPGVTIAVEQTNTTLARAFSRIATPHPDAAPDPRQRWLAPATTQGVLP